MRAGRAVGDVPAGFPARYGARMDPEFVSQRGIGGGAPGTKHFPREDEDRRAALNRQNESEH